MPFVKSEVCVLLSMGLLLPALTNAADAHFQPVAREEVRAVLPDPHAIPEQPMAWQADVAEASLPAAGNEPAMPPSPEPIAGMGESVPLDALAQYRGGSSVNAIKSEAISNGLLQDATATNVATGNNTIADGAFSNAIGLPIVIQNSGANVLIQNSTIVNVQFR